MDVCKHHFLVTEEENKLESLLHCIQFIFSFYELINHQVFPDYEEAIKKPSSLKNRKMQPLSSIWNLYVKDTNRSMEQESDAEGEGEMEEEIEVKTKEESSSTVPTLSLYHYYKVLRYLFIFREKSVGSTFSSIFNLLFFPLFDEFYTSIYLVGLYSCEKACFTIPAIEILIEMVFYMIDI